MLSGPLPLEEALPLIHQLIDALEYAHEKGIVHRDLKPANIMVTPEGRVKVLDFGLAKAMSADMSMGDPASSPTLTMQASRVGIIVGTAAYMAPEQARGQSVDKRADIWAFGVVVYELVTGRRLFEAPTVSDTLAAVLTREPNLSAAPPSLRRLLRWCLVRDANHRLRDISGARPLLEDEAPPPVPQRWLFAWLWPALAAAGLLASALLAFVHYREAPSDPPLFRFQIPLPEKAVFNGHVSVSPDGRRVAFSARGADGRALIWLHDFDKLESRPLAGTDNGGYMFWSPDSRHLVFSADDKLKRIDLVGGPPQIICDTQIALGGAWTPQDVILFGAVNSGLSRVNASGGRPIPLTHTDPETEINHSHPVLLPDKRRLIYHVTALRRDENAVYVTEFTPGKELPRGKKVTLSHTGAQYVPGPQRTGHLLFVRGTTLMAQAFDEDRLEVSGEAYAVAEQLGSFLSRPFFSVSGNGVLTYWTGGVAVTSLVWCDRQGSRTLVPVQGAFMEVSLAPDGERAALGQRPADSGSYEVTVLDLKRAAPMRITFESQQISSPVWSPDGQKIAYSAMGQIRVKAASGAGAFDTLPLPAGRQWPTSWSRDGKYLLYETLNLETRNDLWVLPMGGKPAPYLNSTAVESQGIFSPDGRFVAYVSTETGRQEVYIQQFPVGSGKWNVSTAGGSWPRWRADGKELFFIDPGRNLMSVTVNPAQEFQISTPVRLFSTDLNIVGRPEYFRYDVAGDGRRFLFNMMNQANSSNPMTVVLNWKGGK